MLALDNKTIVSLQPRRVVSEDWRVTMTYKAQLLHLKAQRKQRSKYQPGLEFIDTSRNIDVITRLIDHQLDHITIKV